MNEVNGSLIWYYYICKREVWLLSHSIEADQDDENMLIGKLIHAESYNRDKKEIEIGNSRIDAIEFQDNKTIVIEIKKSSKSIKASKMQLLYYLYKISGGNININIKGMLKIPKENKVIEINLDNENVNELTNAISDIDIIRNGKIPVAVKNAFCNKCAYNEFCWS